MARIVRRPCVVPRRFNSLEPNFYETLGSPECPKSLGVLLLAAFMMGTFGYDWHLLGVLGVGFTIWGVIEFVRDSLKTK